MGLVIAENVMRKYLMIATPASEIIIIIALMLACYMSLLHVTFLNTCLSCDGIFKMYHNVTSIDNYCWGKFFSFCFSFSHLLVIVYSFPFRSLVFF